LIDRLVEPGGAFDEAMGCAPKLSAMASLPIAFTKEVFAGRIDSSLDIERSFRPTLLLSEDYQEGKRAFHEKHEPRFTGR
jgi:enoyl-CoA hydratase/carnithine racemase